MGKGIIDNMKQLEKATFGAGCFWGVEEAFKHVGGILNTEVGFMGGTVKNPTYIQVCNGKTKHAEVVYLEYDPKKVSYQELLDKFFEVHDPTQLNRQGLDVGNQYRSIIFYYTPEQEKLSKEAINEFNESGKYDKEVVTVVEKAEPFYRAEEYHQGYLEKRNLKVC